MIIRNQRIMLIQVPEVKIEENIFQQGSYNPTLRLQHGIES
jgi:hypothetical protein